MEYTNFGIIIQNFNLLEERYGDQPQKWHLPYKNTSTKT